MDRVPETCLPLKRPRCAGASVRKWPEEVDAIWIEPVLPLPPKIQWKFAHYVGSVRA